MLEGALIHNLMQQDSHQKSKASLAASPSKSVVDSIQVYLQVTDDERAEKYVNSQYLCKRKLGSGGFGEVWSCVDLKGLSEAETKNRNSAKPVPVDEHLFAMKIENLQEVESKDGEGKGKKAPVPMSQSQLLYEQKIYKILNDGIGIPAVHWFGQHKERNVMVMDTLGCSLEELFRKCSRKFSLKTVLMLADQMIQRIEYIHSRLYLHRDIKPDNFLMGIGRRQHYVYVIDFGLTKRYRDSRTGQHIPYKDGKSLTGTARYASLNTHIGIEQSRRDDLECLGFVLIYFLMGGLPWQGVKAKTRNEKYEIIKNMKVKIPIEELVKMKVDASGPANAARLA